MNFETLEKLYNSMVQCPLYRDWQAKHQRCLALYNGSSLVTTKAKEALDKQGANISGCNLIAPKVDTIRGIFLQNDYKFRATAVNKQREQLELEEAVNQFLLTIQDDPCFQSVVNDVFLDALISGIGTVVVQGDLISGCPISRIAPENCIYDFRNGYEDLPYKEAFFYYPNVTPTDILQEYDEQLTGDEKKQLNNCRLGLQHGLKPIFSNPYNRDTNYCKQRLIIKCFVKNVVLGCEVHMPEENFLDDQDPQTKNYTRGTKICISDEELELFKKAGAKISPPKAVTKVTTYTLFNRRILKTEDHTPFTEHGNLPVIPLTFNPECKGFVENTALLQLSFNEAWNNTIALAGAKRTFIFSSDAQVREQAIKDSSKLRDNNAYIVLDPNDKVQETTQKELLGHQVMLLQQMENLFEKTTGIEQENKGVPTNASSGTAIMQRDIAGQRPTHFIFFGMKVFKLLLGERLLEQLSSGELTNIVIRTMEDGEIKTIILNNTNAEDIKSVNDITVLDWKMEIELAQYNETVKSRKAEQLSQLLQSQQFPLLLQSPKLLGYFVDNPEEIIEEMRNNNMQSEQI